ncbi:MAG: rhodanese-like domain-containing protein [Burkholderiales bacterium]|nr:rhodanese-like domain-containing protein [Burkholderiales bacterium]MDQ3197193.1 rhodanese-like domain-containing protein [Pseudomonadota bacterium]
MSSISEILKAAQDRAKEMSLPYEGALLPGEAFELMQQAPGAKLVDVRTQAEWDWVGRVPGAVEIEWMSYPGMVPNEVFMQELGRQVDKESLVMFMCRSGARSHHAAMAATEAGFPDCYNVLEGFEGDKDADRHRNSTGGWKAAGLPWIQN